MYESETRDEAKTAGTTRSVNGLNYKVTSVGTVTATGYSGNKRTSVKVPNTVSINGLTYRVTAIASKAFCKKTKLKSVGKYALYKVKKVKIKVNKSKVKAYKKLFKGKKARRYSVVKA